MVAADEDATLVELDEVKIIVDVELVDVPEEATDVESGGIEVKLEVLRLELTELLLF